MYNAAKIPVKLPQQFNKIAEFQCAEETGVGKFS
jgi:hypothetical protein